MNTAAGISFIIVMLLGMGGLTGLVYRDRRRTTSPVDDGYLYIDQIAAIRIGDGTIYDATIAALGDPAHIDLNPPAFAW